MCSLVVLVFRLNLTWRYVRRSVDQLQYIPHSPSLRSHLCSELRKWDTRTALT